MICRNTSGVECLKVDELNRISVLVDRSETGLTEVGINEWKAGLVGPPHSHSSKEQVFYIVSGEGSIHLSGEPNTVRPGDLVYVPVGVLHRSVASSGTALRYLLFNAFLDYRKEGHATFADHVAKTKSVRTKQAMLDTAVVEGAEGSPDLPEAVRSSKLVHNDHSGSAILLTKSETHRIEAERVTLPFRSHRDYTGTGSWEHTLYIISGAGKIGVGHDVREVSGGDTLFITAGKPFTCEGLDPELSYLRISTRLD
ncbi:MAG TPA: cupin domain-containing protein [Bryobacteraceae bacterium]|nr:cupin domain-containing protein [Bryobacteraceae bacterium]